MAPSPKACLDCPASLACVAGLIPDGTGIIPGSGNLPSKVRLFAGTKYVYLARDCPRAHCGVMMNRAKRLKLWFDRDAYWKGG